MGYTHYWERRSGVDHDAAKFADFARVAAIVVELATKRGIKIGDALGEGKPYEINGQRIALNGVGAESHESFVIARGSSEFSGSDFCKTNEKPYDVVVVAILVLYKHLFPDVVFSSDGDLADLQAGLALVREALGVDLVLVRGKDGFTVVLPESEPVKKKTRVSLSESELELVKHAISFLSTHVDEAAEELDVDIDGDAVEALEKKLYG
jgi:microcompartment protein CcmK/EutM